MYQSPVPLIVIRSAAHSLIEVNGQILGECRPGSHVAMPAGDTGDYYISATPLEGMGWPTTRKLTLDKGAARKWLALVGIGVAAGLYLLMTACSFLM